MCRAGQHQQCARLSGEKISAANKKNRLPLSCLLLLAVLAGEKLAMRSFALGFAVAASRRPGNESKKALFKVSVMSATAASSGGSIVV